jgi:hypothetical protein
MLLMEIIPVYTENNSKPKHKNKVADLLQQVVHIVTIRFYTWNTRPDMV